MTTTTFETAEVGDKVWSFSKGWGTITGVDHDYLYPLLVNYDGDNFYSGKYTLEGKFPNTAVNPTIFWGEIEFTAPPKPLPILDVDTKVLVWRDGGKSGYKLKRYFSHFDEKGRICVFENGATSWLGGATVYWDNWELAE